MIHIAAFSGGKDSTALLLWLREQGIQYTAVFCDTGWEHPMTYAYIEEINQRVLGGALVCVANGRWNDGMKSLVAARGRIPSARARFCTEELKVFPMRDYLRSLDDEATVYQGIRADESPNRARMKQREWSEVYDAYVERPLLLWSADDVFALIRRHGLSANPLYRLGSKRVGCFPCVMTRHAELRRLSTMMPEVWDRIGELEAVTGTTFFPPDYIPARFCAQVSSKGYGIPSIAEVRAYVIQQPEDLFTEETPTCMSVYNLCE